MTDNAGRHRVDVYIRHDCGLCEQLLTDLRAFRDHRPVEQAFEFSVRDIEERPDWLLHYTDHVPVIVVDDEEICHYFLDIEALEGALTCQ